jgi:regulator of replication initiation timing
MTATEYPTFRGIPAAQQPSDHTAVKRELRRALLENRHLARENEELRQQLNRRQP